MQVCPRKHDHKNCTYHIPCRQGEILTEGFGYKSFFTILAFQPTPISLISCVRRAPSGSPA